MTRITILFIFITSTISAINPPQQGTIPDSVLQLFRYQEIGDEYGNPGWIKKLQRIKKNKQNRNEQLYFNIPVLLGKYSDQAQTYFTASEFNQLLFDNNPTGTPNISSFIIADIINQATKGAHRTVANLA